MIRLISAVIAGMVAAAASGCGDRGRAAPAAGLDRTAAPAVRVAAASDLKFAFDEVVARLQTQGIRVEPTYGSSGNFHAQLIQRAPFDLYLSADVSYPRDLVASGIGSQGDLFTYALGHLVIWVPSASRLPIERDGMKALAGASRVAMANPRHAPYGRAAEAAMRCTGIWTRVQPRIVIADNIAQAAQFVESGSADAGFIARSLAVSAPMRKAGRYVDVPSDTHPPLVQGGLVLPWARSPDAATAVRDFLLGADGRALLQAHGFDLPEAPSPAAGPPRDGEPWNPDSCRRAGHDAELEPPGAVTRPRE